MLSNYQIYGKIDEVDSKTVLVITLINEQDLTYKNKSEIYSKFKNSRPCFKKKNKKIYFNLRKFIIQRLVDSGLKLKNISHINKDTYMLKQFFFSFRLSKHKNELDYGRNLSIITKK